MALWNVEIAIVRGLKTFESSDGLRLLNVTRSWKNTESLIHLFYTLIQIKNFKNRILHNDEIPGGGVLPSKRLLGMCRWMGSDFQNWIDYNGVTFLVELAEWVRTFSGFLG